MNDDRTQVDRTVPYRAEVTVASTPSTVGESRLPRPLAIGQRWRMQDGVFYTITAGPRPSPTGRIRWLVQYDDDSLNADEDDNWFGESLLGDEWGDAYAGTTAEAHATLQQVTNTTPHEVWGEDAGL